MKVLTSTKHIIDGARADSYSSFTASQLLEDFQEVEALRARLAELEAVAEKTANVLQWALDDGLLSSYRKEANEAIVSHEAYKSKHTSEQGL